MTGGTGELRIAGVVLAAGSSRRMGPVNKLLAPLDDVAVVTHTVGTLLATSIERVLVVTGHEHAAVERALREAFPNHATERLAFVANRDHKNGMGTSIAAGVAHIEPVFDGLLIVLGDMPRVRVDTIDKLIAVRTAAGPDSIAVPLFDGMRGNPVLFGATYRPQLLALDEDQGARAFLGHVAECVIEVPVDDSGVVHDIDVPADLEHRPSDDPGK